MKSDIDNAMRAHFIYYRCIEQTWVKYFLSIKSTLTRKKNSIYELDIWYKKYTDKTYGKLDKITIKKTTTYI